jgi:hypothetical protein
MDAKKIIELRKQAEKSVAEMPDGEIKLKAFEVILSHLLTAGQPKQTHTSPTPQTKGSKREEASDIDADTADGRILVLKDEGYFKTPQSIGRIREELQAHGWHYPVTTLSGPLMSLVQKRKLRRQKGKDGNRQVWVYTNP